MKIEKTILGFADLAAERRICKKSFLEQINRLIDWRPVNNMLNKYYKIGQSETGRPAYSSLCLFKICWLQKWYGLGDPKIKERINDSISFSKFLVLSLEEKSPDHSTICRFRNAWVEKNIFEKCFKALNKQLEKQKIIVKSGILVDASITKSPFLPDQKPDFELPDFELIEEDREIDQNSENFQLVSPIRYRVERTFGSIKCWFKSEKARYKGRKKVHAQHILEAIAYNLYRLPKIAIV